MTFQDIFKSGFLENVTSISMLDMLMTILFSFGIGLFIFFIYKKTYRGVMYSDSLGTTLIALTMITSIVIFSRYLQCGIIPRDGRRIIDCAVSYPD